MKTVLRKLTEDEARQWTGAVYVDVTGECDDLAPGEYAVTMSASADAVRTIKQNSSIHLYCKMISKKLNDGGLDMMAVLKEKSVPVSWTMNSVKDVIWRPIQIAMFDIESTTKLERPEVTKVYETMARHLSTLFTIDQSFPNRHGD